MFRQAGYNDIILQMNGLKKGRECYCDFISQWRKRSKPGLLVFPPKKTLICGGHVQLANRVVVRGQSEESIDFQKDRRA